MDLAFSSEDRAFREEVLAFVEANLPGEIRDRVARGLGVGKEALTAWQRTLHEKGWVAPAWPRNYGGAEWPLVRRYLFQQVMGEAAAPDIPPFGVNMVGPVIYTFGNEAQKARFLPRVLSGEDWWCQGYSEPGSGSDLASLRTRAEDQGDHYLVNGQKIWTTYAHLADWIFCLVRTDDSGRPQEGISFLLIDMKTPGITVRPIITIDHGHSVNEVFFEDVRVPKENLVGEPGKGWTYAKFLLSNERTGIAHVASAKRQVARIKSIAGAEEIDGRPLIEDRAFRARLAAVEVDLMALEFTELRLLSKVQGGGTLGAESSLLKIRATEIQQSLTGLLLEALGNYAAPFEAESEDDARRNEPPIGPDYRDGALQQHIYGRAATIYGGSNEIQRNIIAKMVLGL
ncbi:acyl-CoA dehydrogenase family protein [Oceanibacterium hippocampi]|uniref:Acyl-CoA dehydrogenase n=1 Tax=Oceanibacterium hippocampi TaxID=745714 RepID=A0A1Y5RZY4_9PROT|nr:acyl-CoA dehydrogenase family protein [Oceanibacterium hippocampi]SLN29577.1 Acyl-CoA dehydrogenase [Oceanibacterium hippocampi]